MQRITAFVSGSCHAQIQFFNFVLLKKIGLGPRLIMIILAIASIVFMTL